MPKETSGPTLMKDRISPDVVTHLADLLAAASKSFKREEFLAAAIEGLESMEMKARVIHVADALAAGLPANFPKAAKVIDRALKSPELNSWMAYPVDDYVARYGIDFPEVALPLMGRLTKRWSCEFAIRPFIREHAKQTFEQFDIWIGSDDEDLRRLVSEGSRPRLPWGGFIPEFVEDPTPTIALLDRLVDDPSLYVRKSVANHLNDIAKDRPDWLLDRLGGWSQDDAATKWIVRHALRTLIKAGEPRALALIGVGHGAAVTVRRFAVEPATIRLGDQIAIAATLFSDATDAQSLVVDYRIHYARAGGKTAAKVFKWKSFDLAAGETAALAIRQTIRDFSTRRHHPGRHAVDLIVNGRTMATSAFEIEGRRDRPDPA